MEENVIQIIGGIMINVDESVKSVMYVKKNYVWNLFTCNCEHKKYLASIINDSPIIYDEVKDADVDDEAKS